MIFALDPGPAQSALVVLDGLAVRGFYLKPNDDLMLMLRRQARDEHLVIEDIQSYGMPVGVEIFQTVFWSGRFAQAWPGTWSLLPRRAVKLALCHSARATDATVRQALIDRYGPGRQQAIGTKKAPGPLYGITGDCWQALALAIAYEEAGHVPR